MTDTWQSGSIPPPPTTPPPGLAPAPAPTVNPFLGGAGPGRAAPSRGKLAGLVGVVAVAAAGAWFAFGHHGSSTTATPPVVTPTVAPATTAAVAATPTVAPLAAAPTRDLDLGTAPKLSAVLPQLELFVEEARGHRFTKPLAVTPLSNKAFVAALIKADGVSKPNPDAGASPKALHLLPPDFDANAPGSYDDIGGFYDPKTKHLYVRSITLNPLAQSIIAHEMTHALDDEYFDLTKIQRAGKNSDQDEAIRSLIEGDARAVENRFNAALTTQRKAQEDAERSALLGATEAQAGGGAPSPFVLELFALFPYEIGSGFIDQLVNDGGQARVDQAFRQPPTSTLQIIDPGTRFLHRVDARTVAAPAPAPGRVVDHDVAGALALSAVLAEAAPTKWLLQTSVEAWAGDSYITTKQGSRTCVKDAIRTTSAAGRVRLGTALTSWSHQHAGASVTTTGTTSLLLVSCTG
ncbi:hypothetical protein acdb102_36670 [Acidothermaceae bacterium B102]|nr:hypothetical protein acdb102_36670 [Acidothermaceae bacterium B102]